MPVIKTEEYKVRHLPVLGRFYHHHKPLYTHTLHGNIDEEFKRSVKVVSAGIKEHKESDLNTALFSALLALAIATYAENKITFTLENKINDQLRSLFR